MPPRVAAALAHFLRVGNLPRGRGLRVLTIRALGMLPPDTLRMAHLPAGRLTMGVPWRLDLEQPDHGSGLIPVRLAAEALRDRSGPWLPAIEAAIRSIQAHDDDWNSR